jgi:hypothetical protein
MNDEDKTGSAPGENSVREGNLFSNTNILIANASDSCTWGEIYRSRQDQPVGFAKIIEGGEARQGLLFLFRPLRQSECGADHPDYPRLGRKEQRAPVLEPAINAPALHRSVEPQWKVSRHLKNSVEQTLTELVNIDISSMAVPETGQQRHAVAYAAPEGFSHCSRHAAGHWSE